MKRNNLTVAVSMVVGMSPLSLTAQEVQLPKLSEPQIEEVFVMGKFVPDEKRDTSEISNVLDEDDLAIMGETSVGLSLSRVTGLSLVDGKYVYVRGLGERYSSTLLNASRISSPVPFQKTVPLDIIPSQIVNSLLVQKTYSAKYPGDFSGGVVDIRTKNTPDENFINAKLSVGGNSQTTGGDGLYYSGGNQDNWGWDDGTRMTPRNVGQLSSEEFEAVVGPDRLALGNSFYNNWDIREKELKPNMGGEFELGTRTDFDNDMVLGFIGAFKYSNVWMNRDKDYQRYEFSGVEGDNGTQTVDYKQFTTKQTIGLNAFATVGLELNIDHSLAMTYTLMRQSEDELQQHKGLSSEDDVSDGTFAESYRLQWTENEIESLQLSGEHYFPSLSDFSLNWRAVDGSSYRDAPDTRTYTYAQNRDGVSEIVTPGRQAAGDLRDVFQAPQRSYSRLDDDISDLGFDLELPFSLGDRVVTVSGGWGDYERTRESEDRLFRFDISTQAEDYISLQTPSQLFDTPNWQSSSLTVRDFSAGAANASGIYPFAESGEEVTSYYLAIDAQILPSVRLQTGVRREDVTLTADAWGGNTEQGTVNSVKQDYKDTLPSLSLTWEFMDNMQLRMAYSETVNRPSLLEITGTTIRNPEDSNLYRGNVFLQPAELTNYDLRWEWYFGAAESMSLGVFRKEFDDPIELAKVQAQNDIFTWFNAEQAELEGIEYEIRKDLYIGEWFDWSPMWNNFTVSANMSWIDSTVTMLGAGETAADAPLTGGRQIARLYANERPITGQSDWLGNILLTYQDDYSGIMSTLAYNYTGERVSLVGSESAPDVLEEGRGRLDMLFRYNMTAFGSGLELEAKAANLTDEEIEWTQGGNLYERYSPGVTYSFSARVNF